LVSHAEGSHETTATVLNAVADNVLSLRTTNGVGRLTRLLFVQKGGGAREEDNGVGEVRFSARGIEVRQSPEEGGSGRMARARRKGGRRHASGSKLEGRRRGK